MGGRLFTSVNPRALKSCLTMAMNGARSMVTWPLLTAIAPLVFPERASTSCSWATVLTCSHTWADRAMDKPGHRGRDSWAEGLEQCADAGEALGREQARRLSGQPGDVEMTSD